MSEEKDVGRRTMSAWKKHLLREKPKTAICRLNGCGGCDEAILDIHEDILKLSDQADIVFWPMAIDSDYDRLEEMKDEEIALSVIHGAVSNAEHEQMAALIRKKSRLVLALGSCASYGGMMNLADLRSRKNILRNPHRESPKADAADRIRSLRPETRLATKNEAGKARPDTSHEDGERVCALHEIIKVDYILPGCPPPSSLISDFFFAGQENTFPPKGTILSPGKALCSVCPRARIKPARMEISGFKRIHEIEPDESCFLAQGILCMGPVIRSGCGEACIRINLPCRGCFGAADGVHDVGLDFLSGLAPLITAEAREDVCKVIGALVDLSGYCYRFSPPSRGVEKSIKGGIHDAKNRQSFDHQGDQKGNHNADQQARRAREDRTVP